MKLYNNNIDRVEVYRTILTQDGTLYPNKLTEEQLNSYGYYFIELSSPPNRRYYTYTETKKLVGNKYKNVFTTTDRPLTEVQEVMLKDLSEVYSQKKVRPRVPTSLGFDVDGGYNDIVNFQIGKEFGLMQIKDADNIKHNIISADYDTIINDIKLNGINLFSQKDIKEQEIMALTTTAECEAYENEPYDYTVTQEDVDNDIDGTLTVGQVITRYRNNVKEW